MCSVPLLLSISVILAIGGTPPPSAQAQSFSIKSRITNSSARAISHNLRQKLVTLVDLESGQISPSLPSGLYYVEAHIGTPPFTVNLAIDPIGPLTWVQSADCQDCFIVSNPNFDPKKSTTFQPLPSSNTTICSPPLASSFNDSSTCTYDFDYTKGTFGMDKFFLSPSLSNPTEDDNALIAIGFGTNNFVNFDTGLDYNPIGGVIGLGKGHPSSIVSQMGSDRFSYCLPSPESTSDRSSLDFGSHAKLDANAINVQTTQIFGNDYNYLKMSAVTLNGEIVFITPEDPARPEQRFVLLDTGAPETQLVEEAYYALQAAVMRYFEHNYGWKEPMNPEDTKSEYDFCYDISSTDKNPSGSGVVFPELTVEFVGGARFVLQGAFETFADVEEMCMTITGGYTNIVGVFQQMNYRFLLDVGESKISFASGMC